MCRTVCLCYLPPEPVSVVVNRKRKEPPSFIHSLIHPFRNVKEEGWKVDEKGLCKHVFWGLEH